MKTRIVLFAKNINISEQKVNYETGEVEEIKFNTQDILIENGIKFMNMPNEYLLAPEKNGKKKLLLSDLGTYILCKIDEEGKILNEFNGRDLRRPLVLSASSIIALASLKDKSTKPKQPSTEKK